MTCDCSMTLFFVFLLFIKTFADLESEILFTENLSNTFDYDDYIIDNNNKILSKCYQYTNCYDCVNVKECHWNINGCSNKVLLDANKTDNHWWNEYMNCQSYQELSSLCPLPWLYTIETDSSIVFSIPNTYVNSSFPIPENTFCYWKVFNPKLIPIRIRIKHPSV